MVVSVLEDINSTNTITNTAPRTVQRQRSYSASSSSNNSPLPDFYTTTHYVADKAEDRDYTPLLPDGIEEEVLFAEDDFHINRLVTGESLSLFSIALFVPNTLLLCLYLSLLQETTRCLRCPQLSWTSCPPPPGNIKTTAPNQLDIF